MNLDQLTEQQRALLPTEADIALYEQRGWYISPVVLPDELLLAGIAATEAFYRGEKDFECPEIEGPANDVYDETKVLMNNEYVSLQKQAIRDILFTPIVSAIAARLSRSNEIRLFADALMCKFPAQSHDEGSFGWHTDKAYWPGCTSNDMLTAWIPFQDTTLDMGPMYVVENSHQWPHDAELMSYCGVGNKNLQSFEDYLVQNKPNHKMVPLTMKRGQLSFHNCNVFHGSPANHSNRKRINLAVHMQDAKNSYKPAYREDGSLITIGYERMCRKDANGHPDYRDPKFFPVLWDGSTATD